MRIYFVMATLALCGALTAERARGAVTEPDGVQVPSQAAELQALFDQRGEQLDAVSDAATQPSSFSPLCEFTGTLLFQEAQCRVEFGWYNAEEAPGVPRTSVPTPDEVFTLVPDDAPIDAEFSGGTIRDNPNYKGGLIGFAMRSDATNSLCAEYHFSESQWGRSCSACTPVGPWVTVLAYPSTVTPNAFYLTIEDGTTTSSTFGNDGDFDDKVFLVAGITCPGGGLPCETDQDGPCHPGVTECTPEGVICRPLHDPDPEICDSIDNDCNGSSDDGDDLCPVAQVCFEGTCVGLCGSGEFECPVGYQCEASAGVCVEVSCFQVKCQDGEVCRMGECTGPCNGVVCPLGQVCEVGTCVDYCEGVTCKAGQVCEGGACLDHCRCRACPSDKVCDPVSGNCVDDGCAGVMCSPGTICRAGQCDDQCTGAICPRNQKCETGKCSDDPTTGGAGGGAGMGGSGGIAGTGGSGGSIDTDAGAGQGGSGAQGGSGSDAGSAGNAGSAGDNALEKDKPQRAACACEFASKPRAHVPASLACVLGLALLRARKKRRRAGRRATVHGQ